MAERKISPYVVSAMCGCWAWESGMNPGIWESLTPTDWDHEYQYDGIGGYGNWIAGELLNRIEPKGWSIDCLPCGYLRLFSRSTMTAGPALSSFEIYAK